MASYKEEPASPCQGLKQAKSSCENTQKLSRTVLVLAIFNVIALDFGFLAPEVRSFDREKRGRTWSPPVWHLIHTLALDHGCIDIYDCVIVINDRKSLEAFSKLCLFGGEISVVWSRRSWRIVESEVGRSQATLQLYEERGLYVEFNWMGQSLSRETDENARFYGERLPISQILVEMSREFTEQNVDEVVKQSRRKEDVDHTVLVRQPNNTASDFPVESE